MGYHLRFHYLVEEKRAMKLIDSAVLMRVQAAGNDATAAVSLLIAHTALHSTA